MQARIKHPALANPEAMQALQQLHAAIEKGGVPKRTLELVSLRASQINGCGACCHMHPRILKKLGETDQRLFAVAAWRDTPFFTEAERAALALCESVTRLSDREDPVPDAVWAEAAKHYDEQALGALVLSIGLINVWNRVNAATKQVAGASDW